MATAGSGDVLTGLTLALLGQGLCARDAAVAGAYLHGLAGDIAAKDKGTFGLIASDIREALPYAIIDVMSMEI
jgi:NAD(P)H-hydrate epimerase